MPGLLNETLLFTMRSKVKTHGPKEKRNPPQSKISAADLCFYLHDKVARKGNVVFIICSSEWCHLLSKIGHVDQSATSPIFFFPLLPFVCESQAVAGGDSRGIDVFVPGS